MTRKQHKCQYVQEQGVIFSRWIFFFPNWGRHSSVRETKYLVFFPSPKMQLKHKGYLCIFWMRKKKNEAGSSGKGARFVLLSFTCPTARLGVSGPETPLLSCPCSLLSFPTFPLGCALSGWDWQGSLAQSYKEQQSQLLTLVQHCSYLFCFPQRQDRTDDCGYFKMSAWHCGISII